jgi:hypothetical protein
MGVCDSESEAVKRGCRMGERKRERKKRPLGGKSK